MTAVLNTPQVPMSVAQFLKWNEDNQHGRHELFCGEPVKKQAERARHADVKGNVYVALRAAARAAKLPSHVFPDGMTVVINDDTCYEPDAIINSGPKADPDAVTVESPTVVVEVGSPSTKVFDMGQKLADYFTVPGIVHVLLIDPKKQRAILHSRVSTNEWATRLFASSETVHLDPPGLSFDLADCFAEA